MQFSKQELSDATRDFDVDLKVGFGTVYSLQGEPARDVCSYQSVD